MNVISSTCPHTKERTIVQLASKMTVDGIKGGSGLTINSLTGTDADMRPFFDQLRSKLSSDVGIWTQVVYVSDYESSDLALQYRSLKHSRRL